MPRMQFPLIAQGTQRTRSDSTKDSYIKNMYVTKEGDTLLLNKRPGLDYTATSLNTYMAHGIFTTKNEVNTATLFLRWDGTDWDLYQLDGQGSTSFIGNVPTFAGDGTDHIINWAEAGYNGTQFRVAFSIGAEGFIWNFGTGTITVISDVDFLSGTAGLVYLDDYLFASSGADIRHSASNDPFTWGAADIIIPQSMAATGICKIALHEQHIVAIGQRSIEFFYNAGNPVGSVLSPRRDIQINNIGMFSRQAVTGVGLNAGQQSYVDLDGGQTGAFLSYSAAGFIGIHLLSNFRAIKISDDKIDRYLNYKETEATPRYSSISKIIINGKILIILSIRSYISSTEYVQSFAYDIDAGIWIEWTVNTNIHSSGAFNVISSAPLAYLSAADSKIPVGCLVQFADGKMYLLDEDDYQDEDSSSTVRDITVSLQTPKFRGEAGEHAASKFMTELSLIGDRGASTNNVSVEYTDDDYQTYSTARNLDVSVADKRLTQLGTFQERAFRLTHTANLPLRLEHAEIEYNTGR